MDKDYLGNLIVLAGVHSNYVSEQYLQLLCLKYDLSDAEMGEMVIYCKEHGITIYDEEKGDPLSENNNTTTSSSSVVQESTEQKQHNLLADRVSRSIMYLASTKAIKRAGGPGCGWICGTYANSVEKLLLERVKHAFTNNQLQFILDHMATPSDEDGSEYFVFIDQNEQKLCDELSAKLNTLIPKLRVIRFVSDYFDD